MGNKEGLESFGRTRDHVCASQILGCPMGSGSCLPTALPATETPESWAAHGAGGWDTFLPQLPFST